MKYNTILFIALVTGLLTSCSKKENYDATGTFEATEITVSNEVPGKLLTFSLQEGDVLKAHTRVGIIDTTQLYLSKLQLGKKASSVRSNKPDVSLQIAALESQLQKQYTEKMRVGNLLKAKAATTKQLDDINSAIKVLQGQIGALKSTLHKNVRSIDDQSSAIEIQMAQIDDQLDKCHIIAPIDGVVLGKYAEAGEFAGVGKPLFKMADMKHLFLRAYLSAAQLKQVQLGQEVIVIPDSSEKTYPGKITWIASTSEFTPKNIQTADERQNLVYAVKVSVENDGNIKLGMYGNIRF